jgi:hypothetical protein
MMDQRLRRLVTRHGIKTLKVSEATPNGDLLLDFLDRAVWDALCASFGEDFERLQDVLASAMMTWNLSVMRARGRMPDGAATRDFLDRNAQFFEHYSARKEVLFAADERIFLDVMVRLGEDGGPEVNAVATILDPDRALFAPLALRAPPRTGTERNRAKRVRRRG